MGEAVRGEVMWGEEREAVAMETHRVLVRVSERVVEQPVGEGEINPYNSRNRAYNLVVKPILIL